MAEVGTRKGLLCRWFLEETNRPVGWQHVYTCICTLTQIVQDLRLTRLPPAATAAAVAAQSPSHGCQAIARCWYGRNARFATDDTSDSTASAHSAADAATQAAHDNPQQHDQHQQQPQPQQQSAQQQQAPSAAGPAAARQAGSSRNSSSDGRPDQLPLLQLFVDQPGPQAPFSIHNLCREGAPHG